MNSYLYKYVWYLSLSLSLWYDETSGKNIEPLIICPKLGIIYDLKDSGNRGSNEIMISPKIITWRCETWFQCFLDLQIVVIIIIIKIKPYTNLYNANYWVDDTSFLHTSQLNWSLCRRPSSWEDISWDGHIRYLLQYILRERYLIRSCYKIIFSFLIKIFYS